MTIRSITINDYEEIKRIYEKFYTREFEFPDFTTHFLSAFVVTNDSGQIITVAGLRTILEVVALTDQSINTRARIDALQKVKSVIDTLANNHGYERIHAVVHDPIWSMQLQKHGFMHHPGDFLIY